MAVADRKGRQWVLGNQGRVHMLLAAYSMQKIEKVYGKVKAQGHAAEVLKGL